MLDASASRACDDAAWSVYLPVSASVSRVSSAKTDKPIDMLFGKARIPRRQHQHCRQHSHENVAVDVVEYGLKKNCVSQPMNHLERGGTYKCHLANTIE